MTLVNLIDLKTQYESVKKEIDAAIADVLSHSRFILGPEVKAFEEEIAAYLGVKYAVGVASGTDALQIALLAAGIKPGDEVITTTFTFIATAEAITNVGARPVFVDVDARTYCIDPDLIEAKVSPKTRAILPVHLYGHPAEMDKIIALAQKHDLKVIEDCAQAFGAEYKGKKVGSIGDAGCLSFFPGKNLGCFGDGGMVVTDHEKIAEHARMLRHHGSRVKYFHSISGFNSRLDTLQAAILRVKLKYLDGWNEKRRRNADLYAEHLNGVELPYVEAHVKHSFNYFTVRVKERSIIQQKLKEQGVGNMVYYPLCLHLQEVYKGLGYEPGDFPQAEKLQEEVLSLPMFPELSKGQIELVAQKFNEIVH